MSRIYLLVISLGRLVISIMLILLWSCSDARILLAIYLFLIVIVIKKITNDSAAQKA